MTEQTLINSIKETKNIVLERLKELEEKEKINTIKQTILNNGYYLDLKCYKIEKVTTIPLKYYVLVKGYKEDLSDAKIKEFDEKQDPWTDALCFEYDPNEDDSFEELIGKVQQREHNGPYRSRAYMIFYLHYAEQEIPVNKKFKIITKNGEVEELIYDGKIFKNIKRKRMFFDIETKFTEFIVPEKDEVDTITNDLNKI